MTDRREVLLIAAHGERGGEGTNRRLAAIAVAAVALLPWADVRHGVLSGEPSIAQALSGLDPAGSLTVFPLFMSEGWFVTRKLPDALAGLASSWTMLKPLGKGPDLAIAAAEALRLLPGASAADILVIAHGSSKDNRSRRDAEQFARHLSDALRGAEVACSYLEEEPYAGDAVAALSTDAAIVSLFAGEGLHGGDDIPDILATTGFPETRIVTPAADVPSVAAIIAKRYRSR